MRYTPVELRHVKLPRAFLGYRRADVDSLVADAASSFEDVWAERGELADRVEDIQSSLDDVRQREALLASTLVAAERAAAEAVESAKRQAEVIVAEAHQEARSITRSAQAERDRLFADVRRVEALLRAALGIAEEARDSEAWPRHDDTREFQAVELEAKLVESEDDEPPAEQSRDFAWG
jgi:cell division septum initiation protein DivIVA